jgi:hypothetical protein
MIHQLSATSLARRDQPTFCADMREDDAHRPTIQYALHVPIAALIGHAHERRYPSMQSCRAEHVRIRFCQNGVLELNEDSMIAIVPGYLYRQWIGADTNPKSLCDSVSKKARTPTDNVPP